MATRQYLQGRGMVAPAMWTIAFTNVLNIVVNWALVFGHLGLPALGLPGAGLASGLANLVMLLVLAGTVLGLGLHRDAWQPWSRASYDPRGVWRIMQLGLPIGLQFGLEIAAFSAAALMAGWLGQSAVAAHTICVNFAALTFMLPLGLSIGASTRVGNLIGEGDHAAARRAAMLAPKLSASVMTCCALLLSVLRQLIPRAYTPDAHVIALAALIFPIVAGFQIADGTQVVCTGVLRGIGRTRAPAISHFVGYYCLGLPAGYVLAFRMGLGVTGIWWGLLIGLTSVALLLFVWLRRALRQPLTTLTQPKHAP
ncbi:MAG TPA: MATE family efflux transporter, partial [Polyangiales bacterium]